MKRCICHTVNTPFHYTWEYQTTAQQTQYVEVVLFSTGPTLEDKQTMSKGVWYEKIQHSSNESDVSLQANSLFVWQVLYLSQRTTDLKIRLS